MHKLLNNDWDYIQESYQDVATRYTGFGSRLFEIFAAKLPEHYQNLKYFRSTSNQCQDVFAVCEGLNHDFAIQLDPDCAAICLWDGKAFIEIGTWVEDENLEAIKFIEANFLD